MHSGSQVRADRTLWNPSQTISITKWWYYYRGAKISNRMLAMQLTNFSICGWTLKCVGGYCRDTSNCPRSPSSPPHVTLSECSNMTRNSRLYNSAVLKYIISTLLWNPNWRFQFRTGIWLRSRPRRSSASPQSRASWDPRTSSGARWGCRTPNPDVYWNSGGEKHNSDTPRHLETR
jgi:hypothetical protein